MSKPERDDWTEAWDAMSDDLADDEEPPFRSGPYEDPFAEEPEAPSDDPENDPFRP